MKALVGLVAVALLLAGCSAPAPHPTISADTKVLATGLQAPWSILRMGGSTLISERDTGAVEELTADGKLRRAGTVEGVVHTGEGGLLGLEMLKDGSTTWLYAYTTTASDNRIVRMKLAGEAGSYSFGSPEPILAGLAKAGNHNGGRIKFGPDGMLYATVGDAGQPSRAQDKTSLNGKILRMTATGGVPAGNPFLGSLVWSMGHRNPQGLAWDSRGQLWAAEFGQDTWDEINRIVAGSNYGWPTVEGIAGKAGFVDPVYQWATDDASPSGLAYLNGEFFMAALRGERLWTITAGSPAAATPHLENTYGRLRDVVAGPAGTVWILTNNTDGRGSAKAGDDKLIQVSLGSIGAG